MEETGALTRWAAGLFALYAAALLAVAAWGVAEILGPQPENLDLRGVGFIVVLIYLCFALALASVGYQLWHWGRCRRTAATCSALFVVIGVATSTGNLGVHGDGIEFTGAAIALPAAGVLALLIVAGVRRR